MLSSHDALIEYGDNFRNGNEAFTDFVSPVRRPIAVKDCPWYFMRLPPIQEAPSRTITQSLPRASATSQTNVETTIFDANVYTDNDKILFEFPRTGFLDPLSVQMSFNLRCFLTTHNNAEAELFNYDITTMFTRIRLLYNEQEIEDIQRADLLAHIQSCLFDSPQLMLSQNAFLRGKHQVEDSVSSNERNFFNRRNYHSPQAATQPAQTQVYGVTRRYMIPLPLGWLRQKKVIPLHILNGQLRIELTVAKFSDVNSTANSSTQPIPHEGRIEIGRALLHGKVFKQGSQEVDAVFNDMFRSGRLVYGFQSFQYSQFPIRVPTTVAELQSFQTKQRYDIKANMKYARYLIAGITLNTPQSVLSDAAQRYVNVTSTHLHNSWWNVVTKNTSYFHVFGNIRKLSQLYSFQLDYDGKPVTPEIKCSTNPSKYWKTVFGNTTPILDNPAQDDVSNNTVEPFFYYNQAVPLPCGRSIAGRNVTDFFQGCIDGITSSIGPGIRNDIIANFGPAPLIMVVPLSTVLPNGDVAALSLGSGNETLRLTLTWNSPKPDVMVAAVTDATPTPFPPAIQLNTYICYDRLLTIEPDGSIVFEE